MASISKEELRKKIAELLEDADLSKTSSKKVREQLAKELNVDLLSRKKEIDALVMEFVNSNTENGDNSSEDEEEDDKKGSKRASSSKKPAAKRSKKEDSENEEDSDDEDFKKSKPPKVRKLPPKKKRGSDSDSDGEWKKKKKGGDGPKRSGGGYMKSIKLSPALADLVGEESMARHQVVKKVWSIIKERNLYDPKNKQFAICDDALFKVIGCKRFRTFGMMKYLKNHFIG